MSLVHFGGSLKISIYTAPAAIIQR